MTATYVRWYYSVDNSTVAEITDRVELPVDDNGNAIGVGSYAEEGSGWAGQLIVNDQAGDLMMLCHRRIYAVMEAATTRTVVGNWFITDLDVIRMDPFSGAARQWQVSMADENSLLERRILVGTDAKRPAETDIARIRWLLTTTELNTLDPSETYIDTTAPVNMDAVDYTGQKCSDVIADCQQQQVEGWNYFVMYREDLTPHVYSLAYFNFNTSSLYQSTLSLTNVASEVNVASGVYPISADTRLSRSGARLASGEYLPYSGGYVYVQNATTGTTYVYRDVSAPAINVKTSTVASVRAAQHLAQMTEPNDEVTSAIVVEEADLNLAMHGMSIPLHATHLPDYTSTSGTPDYTTGTTMRIKRREVTQLGPTTFRVGLTLTPTKPAPPGVVPFSILYVPKSEGWNDGSVALHVGYQSDGDIPGPGCTPAPTVGPLSIARDGYAAPGECNGWIFTGYGTIDLEMKFSTSGVPADTEIGTISLRVIHADASTGVLATHSFTWGANVIFGPFTWSSIPILAGDRVYTTVSWTPSLGRFLGMPSGIPSCGDEYLKITGGLLTP